MKVLSRFNRFILIMVAVLVLATGMVIYSFNIVFSALNRASEVDTQISDTELRIDRDSLDSAYSEVVNKEYEDIAI